MGITHNIIYYYTKFDIYCGRVYPVPGGWILLTHLSGDGALPSRGALSHVQVRVNPCGADRLHTAVWNGTEKVILLSHGEISHPLSVQNASHSPL